MHTAREKGFTLIELLVVIAIIGLLAGVVMAYLNPAEYIKQTRDARRISDLLSIQITLTNAITSSDIQMINTIGCITCDSINGTRLVNGTGWIKFDSPSGNGLQNYIPILPIDPVNEDDLMFSYYSDGAVFELNAKLESEKYQEYMQDDGGNDSNLYERGLNLTLH